MNNFFAAIIVSAVLVSGIYGYSFIDADGNTISMDSFQGKKILIVNTASASSRTSQYAAMEQLYQQYKDSLVIIAFPSNNFGHEPLNDAAIKSFVTSHYNIHFLLASKTEITGQNQHPLFQWLTQDSLNQTTIGIETDFYKFLISEQGRLLGVYSGEVDPVDSSIIKAVQAPAP